MSKEDPTSNKSPDMSSILIFYIYFTDYVGVTSKVQVELKYIGQKII